MNFEIKQATRVGINPLIVGYSESGCGKTYSALLLARGMAGKDGLIVVADSESGRASLYSDIEQVGGFKTFDLAAPFTPDRYCKAIDDLEQSGAAVGVIDSGSHEWEGPGGVNDMAMENEARSARPGLHNWKAPKFEHAKFVQRLLRAKIPIIVCLRAKYKTRQKKDAQGKTQIIKDETTSPIQAEDFIFEATCHFEILQNHSIILTKCSHPSLRDCFPKDQTTPITIEHGQKLAAWCKAAGNPTPATTSSRTDRKKELELELWAVLKPVRTAGVKSWLESGAMQFIVDECQADPSSTIESLTAVQLEKIITTAKSKLQK